ncbi:MAG: dephospho-CoA kinase [Candidatus Competibacteraceae bacterium]|nr:dephospho-CoA kinase [Candidatus Competibacteraceae bacterium]
MLVVGLTGGIASGKTAVSDAFTRLGVPVIDTDILAREVVEPGQPALGEIVRRFGPGVLTPEGRLDRTRLRRLVFADQDQRRELEDILHPRIRRLADQRLGELDSPYALVVVPLLVETGWDKKVDRVLVVDVPQQLQLARVMARDGVDKDQAHRTLAAQTDRTSRLALANDVIVNDADLATLQRRVAQLHRHYLHLAGVHP